VNIKIMKTHPDAFLPTRAKPGDSGLDLHAVLPDGPVVVRAGDRKRIRTGIAVELPGDECAVGFGIHSHPIRFTYEAQVRPRSGLASKHGVQTALGTIDNGYRGEIEVTLFNLSFNDHTVRHGDRIAQLVVAPVALPEVVEVTELTPTERGSGGFGSTGT
jgi:dUTP pyrophosphatase